MKKNINLHSLILLNKTFFLTLFILLLGLNVFAQKNKVVCIGNSITEGASELLNYPKYLQDNLPSEHYTVSNLGVSAKTLIFSGNSWMLQTNMPDSLKKIVPDIVTIKLGTNDSKAGLDGALFKSDYLKLIDSVYAWSAPDVKIYLCLPIPLFPFATGAWDNDVMNDTIIPKIQEIAIEKNLPIIDLNTPFIGHDEYMITDGVHPGTEGFQKIAELIYDGIRKDITSITVKTIGDEPMEINTSSGFLQFDADFEPFDATHTDFVWTLKPITGNGILDGLIFIATENGTVKIVASNPEGGTDISDEVTVTISGQPETTSINEDRLAKIFPNPTGDYIYLQNISGIKAATIYNLQGQILLEINEISNEIDVSSLPQNTYLLKINTTSGAYSQTFIKK